MLRAGLAPRMAGGSFALANHKSAEKRARQALVRRARNRQVRSALRSSVKALRQAIEAGDGGETQQKLRAAESRIRRAASKGVIKKATANRQVSRLTQAVQRAAR